jgi:hypothetical protein
LVPLVASIRTSGVVPVTVARLPLIFTAFPGSTKVFDSILKEQVLFKGLDSEVMQGICQNFYFGNDQNLGRHLPTNYSGEALPI